MLVVVGPTLTGKSLLLRVAVSRLMYTLIVVCIAVRVRNGCWISPLIRVIVRLSVLFMVYRPRLRMVNVPLVCVLGNCRLWRFFVKMCKVLGLVPSCRVICLGVDL